VATSSTALPAKVRRRLRRIAGDARRRAVRTTGAGQRLTVELTRDDVAAAAGALTPWATRRPLVIKGGSPATVRALAMAVNPDATTLDLTVELRVPTGWPRPRGLARLALPDVRSYSITDRGTTITIALRLAKEASLATALWAVGCVLTPATAPHADGSPDVHLTEGGHPDLAAFGVGAWVQLGAYHDSDAAAVEAESALSFPSAAPERPVVDLSVVNPIGLDLARAERRTVGTARIVAGRLTLAERVDSGSPALDLATGAVFDEHAVQRTRSLAAAALTIEAPADHAAARASARRIAELAATGLVLTTDDVPDRVRDLLDADLVTSLARPLPTSTDDAWRDRLTWQAHSASQRRTAMRTHGAPFVIASHTDAALPSVSVLLVTNRPQMVADAVATVARQSYGRMEIVVGLHGQDADSLPAEAREALAASPHASLVLPIDASRTLGEALALCTTAASGTLLVKMDDDDHYGPHHVWDLVLAKVFSGADLVGKAPDVTELRASQQVVLRSFAQEEVWGAYVIGATMLVARGPLLEVGGWRPTPWAVDKALLDRFGQRGRNVYRTQNLGWAYVRRGSGHTWEQDDAYFRGQAKQVWDGSAMDDVIDLVINRA
jgi:hypothetical protein